MRFHRSRSRATLAEKRRCQDGPNGGAQREAKVYAVHPGATTAVTTPDIQAVDIEAGLDGASAKAANGPDEVEEVNVWCHRCYQRYRKAIDGYASEDQPEPKVGELV